MNQKGLPAQNLTKLQHEDNEEQAAKERYLEYAKKQMSNDRIITTNNAQ